MQRFPSMSGRTTLCLDEDVGYLDGGPGLEVIFGVPGPAACAAVTNDGTHVAYVPRGSPRLLALLRHTAGTLWACGTLTHDARIEDVRWEEAGAFHALAVRDEYGAEWRATWDGAWRLQRSSA